MSNQESKISFDKLEKAEWQTPDGDRELNPLRSLQSDPHFFEKHLKDAPNLKAVAAILGLQKEEE